MNGNHKSTETERHGSVRVIGTVEEGPGEAEVPHIGSAQHSSYRSQSESETLDVSGLKEEAPLRAGLRDML